MTEEKQDSTDFELMDREDEEQILGELRGVPAEKFIYKNSRGQPELSYAGTKWAVREMASQGEAIRLELPDVKRCPIDPEYITVNIIGKRIKIDRDANCETLLDTNVGSARGWIKQKLKNGDIVPDEFFYNKTVSKAARNVQQALMPSEFKRKIIQVLLKQQNEGGGGGSRPPGRPQGGPPGRPQGAPPGGGAARAPQNRPPGPNGGGGAPAGAPARTTAPAQRPPVPGGRPAMGGFAGEAPFPASPSQGQAPAPPPRPPQRPPAPAQQAQRPAAPPPPPQQRQAPPSRPASGPVPGVAHQTQSPPGQAPRQAAIDVLQQRFEIVLKQAVQTNDRNVALGVLQQLTGYQRLNDLPKELIEELGPILHRVAKQDLKLENGVISDPVTGEYLYPKPEPQYEEPPQQQAEQPAAAPAEEPMF